MAGAQWSENIVDYNGESSVFGVEVGNVTAVSLPGLLSNIAALRTAVGALILGNVASDQLRAYKTPGTVGLPGDPNAQVERKWLVTYVDSQPYFDPPTNAIPNAGYGKTFNREIATANAALLVANEEFLRTDSDEFINFATAFEAMARSPYGGTVTVQSIELVGRTR